MKKKNTSELQSLDPNGEKKFKFNPMFLSTMAHTKDLQISYCQNKFFWIFSEII